ncbi:hypothetical protein N7478_001176 [Penicillium angulare]|uniref:uncharacterized protein n=1 Tax=Penicillium angulare TaxID=116970 RepID=UPI00253F97B9|nr:uncharacterized protein N7478_001176 [Penicillium angulare]KAJ5291925.1 hypothetical protein N7478_001176 [Penicillium angulare]
MSDHVTPGSTSPLPASEPKGPSRHNQRISHTKSRNGCLMCKSRRVKCDEERPICGACSVREDDCVFPSPQNTRDLLRGHRIPRRDATYHKEISYDEVASIPPSSIPTISIHPLSFNVRATAPCPDEGSTNGLNMHDLTLLQHYILHTSKRMSLNYHKFLVWERVIPDIAAKHAFLMHLLLALAGMDMLKISTSEVQRPLDDQFQGLDGTEPLNVELQALIEHHQKGLQGLQEKLATAKDTDMDVLFAGSMLVVGFAFASLCARDLDPKYHGSQEISRIGITIEDLPSRSDRPQIHWLRLVRGVTAIAQHSWKTIKLGRLRPMLLHRNANDDWKLLGAEKVANITRPENMRQGCLSAFALGAPQAISRLREFLEILRNMSSNDTRVKETHPPTSLSPSLDQMDCVFAAQEQSITVVESIYMRILYVLHLQRVDPCSSHPDVQSEIEEAAISAWPDMVPETFISSLESDGSLGIFEAFSFVILGHLYLPLALLDEIWYFGENFGTEIRKIEYLVAGLNSSELCELIQWPINVVGLLLKKSQSTHHIS